MKKQERSGLQVMAGLAGMIKPLLGIMCIAVIMGCIGNLMATFITVFGGYGLLLMAGLYEGMSFRFIAACIILFAAARGILRYAEQACNHYIAFKLLARIRHKVFAALRRLAPAKLDGSEKGNLISIITSDIELLEVFYAHTISPIAIAVITSIVMVAYLSAQHPLLGAAGAAAYLAVGLVIPVVNSRIGHGNGQKYRDSFGELNTAVLDNLYGLEEILQYQQKENRMKSMADRTSHLEKISGRLKRDEGTQQVMTDCVILAAGIFAAVIAGSLAADGEISFVQAVVSIIAVMSSFGPTAALSALSNNLQHTLASGNRVLNLLEEEPEVLELEEGGEPFKGVVECQNVSFAYKNTGETDTCGAMEPGSRGILDHFSAAFAPNQIHGILGKSGCGKSTLLKLLMRFYETDGGTISYGGENVNAIRTKALRNHISYVTQETFLFHDTIENNIKIADEHATRERVIEAAKKASIHDFIMSLPDGYDTKLSELGDSVSGGEKQRIGIARAFLHDSEVILLDEPTSNIDSLNEGIILSGLEREKEGKTIILVSHRKSTMGIADDVIAM